MNEGVDAFLRARRDRLETGLGHPLPPAPPPSQPPPSAKERRFLLEEAEELYWNEMEWEKLTDQERLDEGTLTALVFPGFLALVRGLLLKETTRHAKVPASPRPEVVEEILRFLGARILELEEKLASGGDEYPDGDDERSAHEAELSMTDRLVDLVLFRLHGLTPPQIERIELALGLP